MFKSAARSALFLRPIHFVPPQHGHGGGAASAEQVTGRLLDAVRARPAATESMQAMRAAVWAPVASARLQTAEAAVYVAVMGYFCLGILYVMGGF